jgi:hypothetical protein
MAVVIHSNINDIARVTRQGSDSNPGTSVWFRSYSGPAGSKPLSIQDIPDHLVSALACLMATGASQPLEFTVTDEPKLDWTYYVAHYTPAMMSIGVRLV